jgi:hypothetical protein
MPALYAAADAYAGLGDVFARRARGTRDAKERADLGNDSRTWYEKSLSTWQNIPNPSGIGPAGFKARDPHEIARRVAERKSASQWCLRSGFRSDSDSVMGASHEMDITIAQKNLQIRWRDHR